MTKEKLKLNGNSLTGVADILRKKSLGDVIENKNSDKIEIKPVTKKEDDSFLFGEKFIEILEEIEKKEYECTGVIYVDEEIKEVFNLLKSRGKGKIKISSLVSYILEDFLEKNKENINAIIKSSNRFL